MLRQRASFKMLKKLKHCKQNNKLKTPKVWKEKNKNVRKGKKKKKKENKLRRQICYIGTNFFFLSNTFPFKGAGNMSCERNIKLKYIYCWSYTINYDCLVLYNFSLEGSRKRNNQTHKRVLKFKQTYLSKKLILLGVRQFCYNNFNIFNSIRRSNTNTCISITDQDTKTEAVFGDISRIIIGLFRPVYSIKSSGSWICNSRWGGERHINTPRLLRWRRLGASSE